MNGADMEAQEAAQISARMKEIERKVDRLEELARQMVERVRTTSSSVR